MNKGQFPHDMNYARQALLPDGFRDILPGEAAHHDALVHGLMTHFCREGYERVRPPLLEYEDSLSIGAGATRRPAMFRLMDPMTQRMMGARTDMTIQMSRLAATRLAREERPLRLAYAGTVLRVAGNEMRPAREYVQVGVELIGSDRIAAEVEVIRLAVTAVAALGVKNISVDLTTAPLANTVADMFGLREQEKERLFEGLSHRDKGALDFLPEQPRHIFSTLIDICGDAAGAFKAVEGLRLAGVAGQLLGHARELFTALQAVLPGVAVTFDPIERHGFEYKSGTGFALFARGHRRELGRGGRYDVQHPDGSLEPAFGFSAYMDCLVALVEQPAKTPLVYLPMGTAVSEVDRLHNIGWRTLSGLTSGGDLRGDAKRLGATHILLDEGPEAL